jgi:serine protease inhibitor
MAPDALSSQTDCGSPGRGRVGINADYFGQAMRQAQFQIAVCLLLIVHAAAALAEPPLAVADNAFGFRLFKELTKTHPAANICISPYSTATVLHMVGTGAAGKTKTEMQRVLGTTGLSFSDINAANRDIAQSLARENTPNVILTTANAIWYRQDSQVKATFIAINQQFYGATVGPLNFDDAHAVNVINAFVEVREEGTEAAAVTGLAAKAQSIPSEPYPMVVDRPFLFFIEDTQTGALLFMGVVFDPMTL